MKLQGVRVLILDGKTERRALLDKAILAHGGSVVHAFGGEESVKNLGCETFHMFITELHSMGLNAVDLMIHCKEYHPSLPVLVLFEAPLDEGVTTRDIYAFGGVPILSNTLEPDQWAESLVGTMVTCLATKSGIGVT